MGNNIMTTSAAPLALEIKHRREIPEEKPASKYRILRKWDFSIQHYTDPNWYYVQKRRTFLKWSWWNTIEKCGSLDSANKMFDRLIVKERMICTKTLNAVVREE